EGERGDDTDQVAITRAFSVTVDGALDVSGAGIDGGDGIGDAEAAIVMGVDADAGAQLAARHLGDACDLAGQTTAVGIAEDQNISAGLLGRFPSGDGVFGLVLVAVEGVFRIVNDGPSL